MSLIASNVPTTVNYGSSADAQRGAFSRGVPFVSTPPRIRDSDCPMTRRPRCLCRTESTERRRPGACAVREAGGACAVRKAPGGDVGDDRVKETKGEHVRTVTALCGSVMAMWMAT